MPEMAVAILVKILSYFFVLNYAVSNINPYFKYISIASISSKYRRNTTNQDPIFKD